MADKSQNRDLVVLGSSAGGFEALQTICSGLPEDLDAAVLVVSHLAPHSDGMLPRALSRVGRLAAINPRDGQKIEKGTIYVAPPDHHMIVEDHHLRVIRGPHENRHRPAIDPTFRSAATSFGRRVIGVVLTGMLDDGTSGLMVVRAHGGTAMVQDPDTAPFPSMPRSALSRVPDAKVVPSEKMADAIAELVGRPLEDRPQLVGSSDRLAEWEKQMAEFDMNVIEKEQRPCDPSQFACPECGGVLWEIDQEGLLRYHCRVGHAYTARHLRAEQSQAIETALWSALRALEESASLYRKMAARPSLANNATQRAFELRASTAEENSKTLRDFLIEVSAPDPDLDEAPSTPAPKPKPESATGT